MNSSPDCSRSSSDGNSAPAASTADIAPSAGPKKWRITLLMAIAAYRAGKGLFFILVALGIYSLADKNLPDIFRGVVQWLKIDPGRHYLTGIFRWLGTVTETNMMVVAGGTLAYAGLALTEGIGLFLRLSWAAYLTIAEFAIFIPIEIYELRKRFSWGMLILLVLNILVVWYLWRNRHRLFRHHLHDPQPEVS